MNSAGEIRTNSARAWIKAARVKTLSGAAVPVVVGCALAAADGAFIPQAAALCLLFAFGMQIAANLINDLGDFLKGADTAERLGPPRACAQGWITPRAMKFGIAIVVGAACAAGLGLLRWGGWELVAVGAACVAFAALYTLVAYRGAGDVLVLVFFGFVPVGFTYYVMASGWTAAVTTAGAACGLVIDTLLTVNNFRDRATDAATGKRTIVVRLGKRGGLWLYGALGVAGVAVCQAFWLDGQMWAALLPILYLPFHIATTLRIGRIGGGRELNRMLAATSRNILIFGALLTLGILL